MTESPAPECREPTETALDRLTGLALGLLLLVTPFVFAREMIEGYETPRGLVVGGTDCILMVVLGVVVAVTRRWQHGGHPAGELALIFLWAGVSVAWSFRPECSVQDLADVAKWLFLCRLATTLAGRVRIVRFVIWCIVVGALLSAVTFLLQRADVFFFLRSHLKTVEFADYRLPRSRRWS